MMDMHSRNQYLKQIRVEYLKSRSKKGKGRLLDESEKRTGLNRKYLVRKLRVLSNLDKKKAKLRRRKQVYDGYVKVVLVKCWEIFDYPCGQRLKPLLSQEVKRLRCCCKMIMSLVKCKMKMSPPWVLGIISALSRNYPHGGRNAYGGDNFEAGRNYKIPGDKGLIG